MQGFYISCIEEIAWRRKYITTEQLLEFGKKLEMIDYGKFILSTGRRNMTVIVTDGFGFIGSNFIFHMLKTYSDYRIMCPEKLTYAENLSTLEPVMYSWRPQMEGNYNLSEYQNHYEKIYENRV